MRLWMNLVMEESVMDVLQYWRSVLIIVVRVEDPNTKLNKFVLIGWVLPYKTGTNVVW
jgi:hypothetical protein